MTRKPRCCYGHEKHFPGCEDCPYVDWGIQPGDVPPTGYSIEGSIYEGMEAAIVRDGRTVAHCPKYSDAVELLAALRPPTAAQETTLLKHRYSPHSKWPWFCDECGYPEHEMLKHLPAQVGRNPKGGDATRLRAEHEHAVGSLSADAPNPSRQGEDHHGRD